MLRVFLGTAGVSCATDVGLSDTGGPSSSEGHKALVLPPVNGARCCLWRGGGRNCSTHSVVLTLSQQQCIVRQAVELEWLEPCRWGDNRNHVVFLSSTLVASSLGLGPWTELGKNPLRGEPPFDYVYPVVGNGWSHGVAQTPLSMPLWAGHHHEL